MQNTKRPLRTIALDIRRDWKNVNGAAAPYLDAMECLLGINDTYYYDSARDIVSRFLVNAGAWRGETARRIKAELRELMA
ncbi:MAG: hypothetical protein EBT13_00380 [Rhodobacteraceae bacterium]|nr:hypothetical protein [Paracoccaceae bacterium]